MRYPAPWRNIRYELYHQGCFPEELKNCDVKLYRILKKYGETFDDEWWYYFNRNETFIKRCPLWLSQKRVDREVPRKFEPNRKLNEFQGEKA